MNIEEIKELNIGEVLSNVSLKRYTTYKLPIKARIMVIPTSIPSLVKFLTYLKEKKLSFKIIGGGSNLIFKGKTYDSILISLKNLNKLVIEEDIVEVESGYNLINLANNTVRHSLIGLEFASGIPGTVGGAIFNNAGAYKGEISDIILEATVLTPSLKIKKMSKNAMQFRYRHSFFKDHPKYIILSAKLQLQKGNKKESMELINERKIRRIASQPLDKPSAGSVFRNPDNISAWQLIDDVGLKGYSINDAKVSEKHANFIINEGNATGDDIVELIRHIQNEVKKKHDIDLILEQEIVE